MDINSYSESVEKNTSTSILINIFFNKFYFEKFGAESEDIEKSVCTATLLFGDLVIGAAAINETNR